MKLSRKKLVKQLILATLATTTLTYCGGLNNIVHADAEFEYPDSPSNNTITVNADNYIVNGTPTSYLGWFGKQNSYLYGGFANSGDVRGNIFNFNGGNIRGLDGIIGGYSANGNVLNNVLNFNNGTFYTNRIVGGTTLSGNATGNTINIDSGITFNSVSTTNPAIFGGEAFNGNAEGNTININGGTFSQVVGGFATGGSARNNTINISAGEITGGSASDLSGTAIPYGGAITVGVGTVEISDNTINISGGTINEMISSGTGGSMNNNLINIWGSPNLSSATLMGYSAGTHSGNALNIASQITAYNIANFDNINFFIPASMTSGGTMLTLTDTSGTDLSGTAIRAAMQAGSNLDTGDTVTLIQSAGTITTNDSTTYGKMSQAEYDAIKDRLPSGMLSDGVSINYEMTLEKSGDNAIIARIGEATDEDYPPTPNPTPTDSLNSTNTTPSPSPSNNNLRRQTEVISEGAVVPTIHLAGYMSDKLVDWLPSSNFAFEDDADDSSDDTSNVSDVGKDNSNNIFMGGGGGSLRTKTGDGSYIDSTMKGFDIGYGRSLEYASGPLVFAPIFEYATGKYDSYLPDGTHGKGDTRYMAGGLIGRKTFKSGFYIEASARYGKTERDFSSDSMNNNGSPTFVHYDKTSAPIFNGHLRIGKQLRLNKNNLLDMYGIYFHAHQGSMNLKLHENGNDGVQDYHFNSANASKIRLGYRLTTRTSKISRIYTGLSFQYEHTSDAVGIYKDRRTPSAGNHGASGMIELGWLIKPNKTNPWMLDLNATGFVGHQKGLTASFKLQKEF